MKTRLLSGFLGFLMSTGLLAQTGTEIDFTISHQLTARVSAHLDINLVSLNTVDESGAQRHLSFAPNFTNTGRLTYRINKWLVASFNYRMMREPSASENKMPGDQGYMVMDTSLQYAVGGFSLRLSIGEALPALWHEEQFDIDYEVFDEPELLSKGLPTKRSRLEARLSMNITL